MTDDELKILTTPELRALQAEVNLAIRAQIRKRNEAKASPPAPTAASNSAKDLARARDAWLARRAGS